MRFAIYVVDQRCRWPLGLPAERAFRLLTEFFGQWSSERSEGKSLLLYHGGNVDWNYKETIQGVECLPEEPAIGCVARHVLGRGGRLIVFSGGTVHCKDFVSQHLTSRGYLEKEDFVILEYTAPDRVLNKCDLSDGYVDESNLSHVFTIANHEVVKVIFDCLVAMDLMIQRFSKNLYSHSTSNFPTEVNTQSASKFISLADYLYSGYSCFLQTASIDITPFSENADVALNKTFCSALSLINKERFKNRLYHTNSEKKAREICTAFIRNDKSSLSTDGGALRFCWDMIRGMGSVYGYDIFSDAFINCEEKRKSLYILIEKAHQELRECCMVVFYEEIPESW